MSPSRLQQHQKQKRAAVLVLGDIGRSPRIQYHATCIAQSGIHVDFIGYLSTRPSESLRSHKNITLHCIPTPPKLPPSLPKLAYLLYAPIKVVVQMLLLIWLLLIKLPKPDYLLVQNPPAIPTLCISQLVCKFRGSKLIIDWHNLGYSILALNLGKDHVFVKFAEWYEKYYGRSAYAHLCVTEAMMKWLKKEFDLQGQTAVLYDKPARHFRRLNIEEIHNLMLKLKANHPKTYQDLYNFTMPKPLPPASSSSPSSKTSSTSISENTILTNYSPDNVTWATPPPRQTKPRSRSPVKSGPYLYRTDRPVLIISSTSWTEDEDFGMLLDAAKILDDEQRKKVVIPKIVMTEPSDTDLDASTVSSSGNQKKPLEPYPPPCKFLIVITGRGPLVSDYTALIKKLNSTLKYVKLATIWLEYEEYIGLMGSADLGLSFHTSSSGLDLPMKVLDMFGGGMPVCARNFECLNELIREYENGRVFSSPQDLAEQILELFDHFPLPNSDYETMKRNVQQSSMRTQQMNIAESTSASPNKIPFLPGNVMPDVTKTEHKRVQTLNYQNGYPIRKSMKNEFPTDTSALTSEEIASLLSTVQLDPTLTYGDKLTLNKSKNSASFIPEFVANDKVVLRFGGYFKQTVHESVEQYLLRKILVLYYIEDDSITVVEPPIENSGILQGVLIKRQKLKKNENEFYTIRDFNLGVNVTFHGKTFRIVECDKFTEGYMENKLHIKLNPPEHMPVDKYIESRTKPHRVANLVNKSDKLQKFLAHDREVLRFYCIWDDRENMFGELRDFVVHYFLVDDCVEVREIHKPNDGRDPFPVTLRRQALPKRFGDGNGADDGLEGEKYTWRDFKIGSAINVLGRKFIIRDCDEYTRQFYKSKLGYTDKDLQPLQIIHEEPGYIPKKEIPPYNGFGSQEDSMQSCKQLVLKPPKKDFVKMLANGNKVLRFIGVMESKYKQDQERKFVISYFLSDDSISIYEPALRNRSAMGGKFLEKSRILKPGYTLQNPVYYSSTDFYIGAKLLIHSHKFTLIDADEFVFKYMEDMNSVYEKSDYKKCLHKVKNNGEVQQRMKDVLNDLMNEANQSTAVHKDTVLRRLSAVMNDLLTTHEILTLIRKHMDTTQPNSSVKLDQFLASLD
ncbi:hypothetical protein BKA69DRAFT_1167065 [Paraphysoderma sedebokerense]|nr:hypothetical protein BKA69DRAFT_1167065 [Paraphysoderma sedebokerense]